MYNVCEPTVTCTWSTCYSYKPPEYTDFHLSRAQGTAVVGDVAALASCLRPSTCQETLALAQVGDSRVAGTVGIATGLIAGGAFIVGTAGFGAAVIGAIGIVGGFATLMSASHVKMANDPPDPNFSQVLDYSNYSVPISTGLGPDWDGYVLDLETGLANAQESNILTLVSFERLQGAVLADELTSAENQEQATARFSADIGPREEIVGAITYDLPEFARSFGVGDFFLDENVIDGNLQSIIDNGISPELREMLLVAGANSVAIEPIVIDEAQRLQALTTGGLPSVFTMLRQAAEPFGFCRSPSTLDSDGDSTLDCIDEDDDNDGSADTADNCPDHANMNQADLDNDGNGDACDCAFADADVWGVPGGVKELVLTQDGVATITTLAWKLRQAGGLRSSLSYEACRSLSASSVAGQGTCTPTGSEPSASDTETPVPGAAFFYLVRGRNACGVGPLD